MPTTNAALRDSPQPTSRLTLPAALLRVWPACTAEEWERLLAQLCGEEESPPGVSWVAPGVVAVLPAAGDPAIFDTAASIGVRLLRQSRRPAASGWAQAQLRLLIVPGTASVDGEEVELVDDPMLADLAHEPPALAGDGVYLTARATQMVEIRRRFAKGRGYEGASGRVVPLFRLDTEDSALPPWRNPELLGRRRRFLTRPGVANALLDVATAPVVRITGPMGGGKSRLVWETLQTRAGGYLWTTARPARAAGPCLAAQLLAGLLQRLSDTSEGTGAYRELAAAGLETMDDLLEPGRFLDLFADARRMELLLLPMLRRLAERSGGPVLVVCDGLEAATVGDRETLSLLAQAAGREPIYRLVAAGRSATPWPEALSSAPEVAVPALAGEEMESLAEELFSGLSLPAAVQQHFIEASRPSPFALEEGLLALVHRKLIRRIYGNFFFSGGSAGYEPSNRLVQHVDAELRRLGDPSPMRLLALAGTPVPAGEVNSALSIAEGSRLAPGWERPLIDGGWLREVDSPWGPGVEIACRAHAQALAATVPPETAANLRYALGEILGGLGHDPNAAWAGYRLLAGTPEGARALIEAARSASLRIPRQQLLAALVHELAELRARHGDRETELEVLWTLLPLARRCGVLRDYPSELVRAIELAMRDSRKLLAFAGLKADLDEQEGRFKEAKATIRRALQHAGDSDERRKALLLIQLGRLLLRAESNREARQLFEQLLAVLDRPGSASLAASCRFYLGNLAFHEGRFDEAWALHNDALVQRRAQKLLKPIGISLSALGSVAFVMGNYQLALAHYREAQQVLDEAGEREQVSFTLLGIGRVLTRLGDHTGASPALRRALSLRTDRGDVVGEALARLAVAENHLELKNPEAALAEARQVHFQLSLLAKAPPLADAEQLLGRILLFKRRPQEAVSHFGRALDGHRAQGNKAEAAFDLAWWLDAALGRGDRDEIRRLAGELEAARAAASRSESTEVLDLRLWRAAEWLHDRGEPGIDPKPALERAYRELLRKAEHLSPELRNRFLLQISDHEEIVNAATRHGLTISTGG